VGKTFKYLLRYTLNWKSRLFLIVLFVLVLGGAFLDPKDFFINVSSGILDVFIGFLIAIVFLDHYQKAAKERQWVKVRDLTYTSITHHLSRVLARVVDHYGGLLENPRSLRSAIMHGYRRPNANSITAIKYIRDTLIKVPDEVQKQYAEQNIKLLEQIRWDLERLGDNLIPRVLQFSDDQEIIDILINLDRTQELFQNSVDHQGSAGQYFSFKHLLSLAEEIENLFTALIRDWPEGKN